MQIRILKDHDHRIKPAVIQAFRAGRTYEVPGQVLKRTALVLIKAGVAQDITTQAKED